MKHPQPQRDGILGDFGQTIRVAHIMFSLEPGGLENGVVNLANGLDPGRFATEIVCLERIGGFAGRLRPGIPVTCLEKPPGLSPSTMTRLARHLHRRRPHLLHTHNLGPLVQAVGARTLALSRVPILHGEHGTLRSEDLAPRRLLLRKMLYQQCQRVHTVSNSLREHLLDLGLPGSGIVPLLNGVDSDRFRPAPDRSAAKADLGFPPDALVIGIVGRLVASKRHLPLLSAFALAGIRNQRAFLLILGDGGELREEVLAAVEVHPLRDRIHWAGHQPEPTPYYQSMDLLAMPSSVEGLSNALLEAMSCGVPCLAHPACGASEVIRDGENGVLRPMEGETEIAAALAELIGTPEKLEEMGCQARRRVEADFSLAEMVARYASIYEDLASVETGGPCQPVPLTYGTSRDRFSSSGDL